MALFTEDAVVIDEGETGMASQDSVPGAMGLPLDQYTTELYDTDRQDDDEYLVTGRLEGNFPGGTPR